MTRGQLSFSWDHLLPPAPSALPIFLLILAPLALFRLPLKQAVRIQHTALENDLVYCGKDHLKFPCFFPVLLPNCLLLSIAEGVDWDDVESPGKTPQSRLCFYNQYITVPFPYPHVLQHTPFCSQEKTSSPEL